MVIELSLSCGCNYEIGITPKKFERHLISGCKNHRYNFFENNKDSYNIQNVGQQLVLLGVFVIVRLSDNYLLVSVEMQT